MYPLTVHKLVETDLATATTLTTTKYPQLYADYHGHRAVVTAPSALN
jgi:hypothetical protein